MKPYYVPSPFLQFHASLSLVFRWSLFSFDIAAYLILSLSFFCFLAAGDIVGTVPIKKWRWHGEEWTKNQSIVPVSTVFVTAISRLLIALNVCVYASLRRSQSGESFTTELSPLIIKSRSAIFINRTYLLFHYFGTLQTPVCSSDMDSHLDVTIYFNIF